MTHCYTRQTLPILSVYTLYMCYYCSQLTANSSPLLDEPLEVLVKPYKWLRGEGNHKNRANNYVENITGRSRERERE